jgi:hypothetical protein
MRWRKHQGRYQEPSQLAEEYIRAHSAKTA